MMQAEPSISMSQATIIGILTIGAGALTNYLVSVRSAARFEGASEQRFKNLEDKTKELDNTDGEQWTEINKINVKLAKNETDINHLQRSHTAKTHHAG